MTLKPELGNFVLNIRWTNSKDVGHIGIIEVHVFLKNIFNQLK